MIFNSYFNYVYLIKKRIRQNSDYHNNRLYSLFIFKIKLLFQSLELIVDEYDS